MTLPLWIVTAANYVAAWLLVSGVLLVLYALFLWGYAIVDRVRYGPRVDPNEDAQVDEFLRDLRNGVEGDLT